MSLASPNGIEGRGGPSSSRTLVRGGRPLLPGGEGDRPAAADILIEHGVITAIGPDLAGPLQADPDLIVIDAFDRLVIPGLVNAHYHSHDTLLKGAFEALPLDIWSVLALPPAFPPRSPAELRVRTLIGAAECLLRGITTVQDMVRLHPFSADHFDLVLDAYEAIGIRAVVAPHFNDLPSTNSAAFWDEEVPSTEWWRLSGSVATFPKNVKLADIIRDTVQPRLGGRRGRVRLGLGPSAPERCSPELLRAVAELSNAHDLPVFTHVAESRGKTLHARLKLPDYGRSHVGYLKACGLLGPRLALAHAVWLDATEIEAVAEAGSSVVLNPQGNLKTRSGIAPIGSYRDAGVNVALGCDNCSCNDSQSMLQTMKAYAGLGALERPVGPTPTAGDTLRAATLGGARALGLADEVGSLEVGKRGDLALFRLDDIGFVPLNSAVRQLVFGDAGPALDKVLVDGQLLVDGGRLLSVDVTALRQEAEGYADELRGELRSIEARVAPLYPNIERAACRAAATPWRLSSCGCSGEEGGFVAR